MMGFVRFKIISTISIESALHISSGAASNGVLDKFMLRDADHLPYLPGSAIKGLLRHNYQKLIKTSGDYACEFGTVPCQCKVCQIFGTAGNSPGVLIVSDCKLLSETSVAYQIRNNVALDRYRKTSKDGALLSYDVTWGERGLKFTGYIHGKITETDFTDTVPRLFMALKMINGIGFAKSRGLGKTDLSVQVFKELGGTWVDSTSEIEGWVKNVSL